MRFDGPSNFGPAHVTVATIDGASRAQRCQGFIRRDGTTIACPAPATWDLILTCAAGDERGGMYCDHHRARCGSGEQVCIDHSAVIRIVCETPIHL